MYFVALRAPGKAGAVVARHAMGVDRVAVMRRRVTDIVLPAVMGMFVVQAVHQPVAMHFGDDRGSGDRQFQPVAADHQFARQIDRRFHIAIDQRQHRRLRQPGDCPRHRFQAGAQNVDLVDFFDAANADGYDGTVMNAQRQRLAHGGEQFLAVVDARLQTARQFFRQDHGCRDHRPRERTAPNLVDAAHHAPRIEGMATFFVMYV